jgi:hypothetical protein
VKSLSSTNPKTLMPGMNAIENWDRQLKIALQAWSVSLTVQTH